MLEFIKLYVMTIYRIVWKVCGKQLLRNEQKTRKKINSQSRKFKNPGNFKGYKSY